MAEHKQYVNLAPTIAAQLDGLDPKRAGTEVQLTAKLTAAREGVAVHFVLKPGARNVAPAGPDKPGLGFPGADKQRVTTDAKGEAHTKLLLKGAGGGDEFEVEAYVEKDDGSKGSTLLSDKYVVWRRIYLQISRFGAGTGRSGPLAAVRSLGWAPVVREFRDRRHNIELVADSSVDLISRRCHVLDLTSQRELLKKSAREGYDAKREPVSMRVVLVPALAKSEVLTEPFAGVEENRAQEKDLNPYKPLWEDVSLPEKADWFLGGQWRYDDADTWKPLAPECVTRVSSTRVRVLMATIPRRPADTDAPKVQVRIGLRVLAGSINGLSWTNTIWIAEENMYSGARPEPDKQQTTIHETGHFIGLVPAAQTATHYTGKDHQGGHCSQGLSPVQKAMSSYRGLPGTCIMFGESGSRRQGQFCDACTPSVRKSSVALARMPADWTTDMPGPRRAAAAGR